MKIHSLRFFISDNGSYEKVTEPGWYIGYKTESGDEDYIGPVEGPFDDKHAFEFLQQRLSSEWENGKFHAHLTHYGCISQ